MHMLIIRDIATHVCMPVGKIVCMAHLAVYFILAHLLGTEHVYNPYLYAWS